MATVAATASGMLAATPSISEAARTEAKEMMAPTDRSTLPVIMTSVTPTAAMPTTLAWRSMLKKLMGSTNPGENQAATRMIAAKASQRPMELRPRPRTRGQPAPTLTPVILRVCARCRWRWRR